MSRKSKSASADSAQSEAVEAALAKNTPNHAEGAVPGTENIPAGGINDIGLPQVLDALGSLSCFAVEATGAVITGDAGDAIEKVRRYKPKCILGVVFGELGEQALPDILISANRVSKG